jgi:prephenate dehydrogenase
MRFKHVTIVGLGLIGGSFALAIRRAGLADKITGWDSEDVLERARTRGVIDAAEDAFEAGRDCEADLVYLSAPVGAILGFLRTRRNAFKAGAIITDAGSTKRDICRVARETLPSRVGFVGGHPMAGSHHAGIEHADADLFRGAPYALVVDDTHSESIRAARLVEDVVCCLGAKPLKLEADEHDRVVARVSHAPQLVATSLACAIARRKNETDLRLAGSGFSEMVRLAASGWSMWEDICRTNADEISRALDEVISEMESARASLVSGDFQAVGTAFGEANDLIRRSGLAGKLDGPSEE